jgi:protein SCO1/2
VVVITALLAAGCRKPEPLPVLGEAPQFELIAQNGQPFDRKSLGGKVWVADFFFTTCTGPCPRMSAQMRQIQNATADTPEVKLVSITVDPAHDTPEVLAEYARRYKADPSRWSFLTGDPARLNDIARNGFKLNSVDGSLVHSTRFALVDRKGRIRAFLASTDDDFMQRMLRGIRDLEREPA